MIVRANFSIKRLIANLFLITGFICLGVCAYSYIYSAAYQYYEGRRFDQERAAIAAADKSPAPEAAVPEPKAATHSRGRNVGERDDPATLLTESTIGRLSVPRLKLNVLVSEGVDNQTLQHSVGHVPGTALPGETGNTAVAGHRDSFFRSLRNLDEHDQIVFTTLHGTYRYVVDAMEIVDPSNVSVLASTGGKTLTIVTCYPFSYIGPAPRRFIVKAHQVDSNSKPLVAERTER